MSPTDELIRNVSDTAIWVAMYRAIESERPDALFIDPYARRLSGERGERIAQTRDFQRSRMWPVIVRTSVFDEFVLNAVSKDGVDTVLNLAAGLDARPWRLPLPAALRWIDVDLPEMLGYKQQAMAAETLNCRYETRAADLREADVRRALFSEIGAASRATLVISEGLIIYLPPEAVAALASDLAAQPSFRWWMFDLLSPQILARISKSRGNGPGGANSPFLFAPADSTRFFAPYGWREREFRSMWADSKRLNRRMPGAWFFDMMFSFQSPERRKRASRMAGNVMLERAGTASSPA